MDHLTLTIMILLLLHCCLNQQSCIKPFASTLVINDEVDFLQTRRLKIIKSEEDTAPYAKARIPYVKKHNFDQLDIILSILSMTNFHDKSGVFLQIFPILSETYFYTVIEYKQTTRWTLAEIHYIVSSREQIRLGNFLVMDDDFQYPSQKSRIVQVACPLKIKLKSRAIKVSVFLTGLKSKSQLFQISINSSKIVNNVLHTLIRIDKNTQPIQRLRISYVLIEPGNNFALKYLAKIMGQKDPYLMSLKQKDKNPILGVVEYNGTRLRQNQNQNMRILTQENHEIVDKVSQLHLPGWQAKRLEMAFTILSLDIVNIGLLTPIAKDSNIFNGLIKRPIQQNKCITQKQCLSLNGTVQQSPYDSSYDCIICEQNQTYDGCSGCKCSQGYVKYVDKCVSEKQLCGETKKFIKNKCVQVFSGSEYCKIKNRLYDEQKDTCKCKEGTFERRSNNGQIYCYKECEDGIYNVFTSTCECPQGTQMKKNKCVPIHFFQ